MNSLKDTALESNPYLKINFDGGDLSSDAGLLLIKEFAEKIGLVKLVYRLFKTNDTATFRIHIDPENLLQMIYQTIIQGLRLQLIFMGVVSSFLGSKPCCRHMQRSKITDRRYLF